MGSSDVLSVEQPVQGVGVGAEREPTAVGEADQRGGDATAVGLGDRDVFGFFEFAQVYGAVPRGHLQRLAQPREGDVVTLVHTGEGGDHHQPGLRVDDRVVLGQRFAHPRARFHAGRSTSGAIHRVSPPPMVAITKNQSVPALVATIVTPAMMSPRISRARSSKIAYPTT